MTAATNTAFRVYELPWTPSPADERRVRRVLGAAIGLFIGLGIIVPLLPDRPRENVAPPAVPERVVEATLATSDRPGFRHARKLQWLIRPFIERSARRLWVDDAAYAERLYQLRTAPPG